MARTRDFAVTPKGILSGLERIAPNVNVEVLWEEDPNFVWDGDGPDPADDGYVAYDVAVKAIALTEGEEAFEGASYLGGVYELPGVEDPDIHGYFTGMLQEALYELYTNMTGSAPPKASRKSWDPREEGDRGAIAEEVDEAVKFVARSSAAIYERDRRRQERRERRGG
jgi:hypothetical protein